MPAMVPASGTEPTGMRGRRGVSGSMQT